MHVVIVIVLSKNSFFSKYNNAWCIPWRTILFEVVFSTIPILENPDYFILKVQVPIPGFGEQVVLTYIFNSFNLAFNGWIVLFPSILNYLVNDFITSYF